MYGFRSHHFRIRPERCFTRRCQVSGRPTTIAWQVIRAQPRAECMASFPAELLPGSEKDFLCQAVSVGVGFNDVFKFSVTSAHAGYQGYLVAVGAHQHDAVTLFASFARDA